MNFKKTKSKIKIYNLKKENNEIRGDIIVKSSKLKPMKTKLLFILEQR